LAATFLLQIASPERVVLRRQAVSLVAPGVEGYLGILARHAPLLAALDVGQLKFTLEDGSEGFVALSGGVLEVSRNEVSVLGDTAELAAEIDGERARRARDRAWSRLGEKTEGVDSERAQLALRRALNRLRVAGS
jgi:F-type H+-transporting ATPase subunit epsilon